MTDSGKNAPLPVKSRDGAERSARTMVDSLASQYGLTADDKTVDKEFYECFGKDHEHATDGRFDLSYSVRAAISGDEHGKALHAMRKKLEAEGYKINGYREKPLQALMDAKGGSDNLFVSVETYGRGNALVFSVETPCFLPPRREAGTDIGSRPQPHPGGSRARGRADSLGEPLSRHPLRLTAPDRRPHRPLTLRVAKDPTSAGDAQALEAAEQVMTPLSPQSDSPSSPVGAEAPEKQQARPHRMMAVRPDLCGAQVWLASSECHPSPGGLVGAVHFMGEQGAVASGSGDG